MQVNKIAVIGAGTMGRGIAYAAALGGFDTVLEDVGEPVLLKAMLWIREALDEGVKRGKIDAAARDAALERITTSTVVSEAIQDADLIIEAVPEDIEMKQELFLQLEKSAGPTAIFASNTSSLSIDEFTGGLRGRERCIGMHFFNPVPKMRLVEIVRTPQTSSDVVGTCAAVAHRMHKETVIVNEAPGFITSRINALIGNEAFRMLEAGIASAGDIDKAIRLGLSHPMGPFELVDLVGLDVRLKILEYLHETLGEQYRPSALLRKYVEEGRLGRKVGRGVYEYRQDE
jgi:3-hydroxybutyryl-CoA dehydrogenase